MILLAGAFVSAVPEVCAAESGSQQKFTGVVGCSTSGCHGGAGDMNKQATVWFRADPHSRAYATLTTARSQRMAESLGMADAAKDVRCTSCHAPMATVPAARREQGVTVEEGVSCESCHGAGSGWIRLHTRKDTTRAQRVAAGMRDLEDLYLRANTCVACHQAIEPALVAAGHPPLEFELEAHQRREPRHWKELWGGGSTWLTGQAAAARELAGRLATGQGGPADAARLEAVLWVVKLAAAHAPGGLKVPEVSTRPTHDEVRALDRLAKAAAAQAWSPAQEAAAREALDAAGKGLGREAAPRRQALDAALLALAPRP